MRRYAKSRRITPDRGRRCDYTMVSVNPISSRCPWSCPALRPPRLLALSLGRLGCRRRPLQGNEGADTLHGLLESDGFRVGDCPGIEVLIQHDAPDLAHLHPDIA